VHAGYDTAPGRLNKLLTDNQGYANGNLIIWQAVQRLFPKVTFVYRHYNYQNDLARAWIDKGIMPIVEVGAAPIGGAPGGKHWVGFVGDKKSVDPWTGTIKDTSTWAPTGMALFDYVPKGVDMADMYKGYDLENKASMRAAVDVLVRGQDGEFIDKPVHEKALKDLAEKMESEKNTAYNNGKLDIVRFVSRELGLPNEITTDTGLVSAIKTLVEQSNSGGNQNGTQAPQLPAADKLKANGLLVEWEKDGVKYKLNHEIKE